MAPLGLCFSLTGLLVLVSETSACNFGPGCRFSCHCAGGDSCDRLTGACPRGCAGGFSGPGCATSSNIARNRPVSQDTSAWAGDPYPASLAVDSNRATSPITLCANAASSGTAVWWRVDFGNLYRVVSIYIFAPRIEHGKHLSAYITNSSIVRPSSTDIRCFSKELYLDRSDSVDKSQCDAVGRSLLLYRNKTSRYLDLCEVEVTGHLFHDCGSCGSSYTSRTSCNHRYGCIATCPPGKDQDTFCAVDCPRGTYGENCHHSCAENRCRDSRVCDPADGSCPGGCQSWYLEPMCQIYLEEKALVNGTLRMSSLSSLSVTIHWSPAPITEPELRQYYGHRVYITDGRTGSQVIMDVNNTAGTVYSELHIESLAYNTPYDVTVFPYRQQGSYLDEVNRGSHVLRFRTPCIAPSPVRAVTYSQQMMWNGSAEIGLLWYMLPEGSGCDRIDHLTITWDSEDSDTQSEDRPATANTSLITFDQPGVYDIRVIAVNNKNLRSISDPIVVTVLAPDDQNDSEPHDQSATKVATIAVVCVLVVLVLVIVSIIVGVFIVKRRKKNAGAIEMDTIPKDVIVTNSATRASAIEQLPQISRKPSPPGPPPARQSSVDTLDDTKSVLSIETLGNPDDPENIYENRVLIQKVIPLDGLATCIQEMASDPKTFEEEFEALPKGHMAMCAIGKQETNLWKNRFKNVISYDHTRVELKNYKGGDYINGNYIQGYNKRERQYIATQGPKPKTITDLWHMVWQEKVSVIVMLTPVRENGKRQSEQYWPSDTGKTEVHGQYTVSMATEQVTAYYTHRKLHLAKDKGRERRTVHHVHYLAWPDKTRPLHAYSALDLVARVRGLQESSPVTSAPVVVHCSAGIGRTGTYIALDCLLHQAEAEGQIDVHSCVHLLRTQRVSLVQTLSQYIFLYDALLEYYSRGHTAVPVSTLPTKYGQISQAETLPPALQEEFQRVQRLLPGFDTTHADGMKPENVAKNRNQSIIPADRFRPYLNTPSTTGNTYINAVLLDTFYSRDDCIVTQLPLSETREDFWRLVYDQNCTLVILLEDLSKLPAQSRVQFWPSRGNSQSFGQLEVNCSSEQQLHTHTCQRDFTIMATKSRGGREHHVTLIQFTDWPETPREWSTSGRAVLEFMETVNSLQKTADVYRKTIVQSLDGARRAGVYCGLKYLVDRANTLQEIDVSLATYIISSRRPQLISSQDEYLALYKMAAANVERFNTYANV